MAETSSNSSILVSWDLSEEPPSYSDATFSIYYGIGEPLLLGGTTQNFSISISGLTLHVNYTIRVEALFAYSTQTFSATTFHILELPTEETNPTEKTTTTIDTNITGVLIGVIVFLLILLAITVIAFIATVFIIKRGIPIKQYIVNTTKKDHSQKVGERGGYEAIDIPEL